MKLSGLLYQRLEQQRRIFSAKRASLFIILYSLLFSFVSVAFSSCAESDGDEAQNEEFANWQARNDAFFLSLEDSLKADPASWQKIKAYTKDENTEGAVTDYIYAKELSPGDPYEEPPLFSDSVRVCYRGRLIPSDNYPLGYIFDQTYSGTFNVHTRSVSDGVVSNYVVGFSTALQHMTRDARWLIYIPYALGYGETASSVIPAYSTLIFDIELVDYTRDGLPLDSWSSRANAF